MTNDSMTNDASITPLFAAIRDEFRTQRAARKARRRLRSELAQYRSDNDRRELEAIMDRHTSQETEEIRSILGERRLAS